MNKEKAKMFDPKLRAARRTKLGENISIIRRRAGLSQVDEIVHLHKHSPDVF